MNKFLTSNDWRYRLLRTIVQGILGVIIANIDLIVGACVLDPSQRALIVALVMAVLSPVMAMLSGDEEVSGKHAEP
jgi:multisubunit Na+/H+ antiporter MnhG subunit